LIAYFEARWQPQNNEQEQQQDNRIVLHGRDASCTIDEHRKSASMARPGDIPARQRQPGGPRRHVNRALP
jgi:hypothetical protein